MATEAVKLSGDLMGKIERASELFGIPKKELVDHAILLYLDNLSKYLDLKEERELWNRVSDEDFAVFEKSI